MESDILPVVQPLQLVAHVLEKESILLRVDLKSALQKSENELDSADGDHSSLVYVDDVPSYLKCKNVLMRLGIA
jgi:hypothetical protein